MRLLSLCKMLRYCLQPAVECSRQQLHEVKLSAIITLTNTGQLHKNDVVPEHTPVNDVTIENIIRTNPVFQCPLPEPIPVVNHICDHSICDQLFNNLNQAVLGMHDRITDLSIDFKNRFEAVENQLFHLQMRVDANLPRLTLGKCQFNAPPGIPIRPVSTTTTEDYEPLCGEVPQIETEPLIEPIPSTSKAVHDKPLIRDEPPKVAESIPVSNERSSEVQPIPENPVIDDDDRDWEFENFNLNHPLARHPNNYENLRQYKRAQRVTKGWIVAWKKEHLDPETYGVKIEGEPYEKYAYEKPFPQVHAKAEADARGQIYEPYLFYELRTEYYSQYPLCFNLKLRDDTEHEVVYDCRAPRSFVSIGVANRAVLRRRNISSKNKQYSYYIPWRKFSDIRGIREIATLWVYGDDRNQCYSVEVCIVPAWKFHDVRSGGILLGADFGQKYITQVHHHNEMKARSSSFIELQMRPELADSGEKMPRNFRVKCRTLRTAVEAINDNKERIPADRFIQYELDARRE